MASGRLWEAADASSRRQSVENAIRQLYHVQAHVHAWVRVRLSGLFTFFHAAACCASCAAAARCASSLEKNSSTALPHRRGSNARHPH